MSKTAQREQQLQAQVKNLKILVGEIGGENAFNELVGLESGYLHNWMKKEVNGVPKPQLMRNTFIERIAESFDRPVGWLHDYLLYDEDGKELKPSKKAAPKRNKPAVSTEKFRSRHEVIDAAMAEFMEETKQKPSHTTLVEFMQWSYGKTLA